MSQGFDDIETVFERFEKARTLDLIIKQDCEIVSDSARTHTEVAVVVPRFAYVFTWRDQRSRKFLFRPLVFATHGVGIVGFGHDEDGKSSVYCTRDVV